MNKFRAVLVTARSIERPVQFFGSSQAEVTRTARGWLSLSGRSGDYFNILESSEALVDTVTFEEEETPS